MLSPKGKLIGDLPIDSAHIVVEYVYEWLIAEQNNDNYERASNRAVKNDLLGGFRLQVDENWMFDSLLYYHLQDKAMFLAANVNWGWAEGYDMCFGLYEINTITLSKQNTQICKT